MARTQVETGGVGLLTPGPTGGARAPQAGDGRRADTDPPGSEPNGGCLTEPLLVTRLCLTKPERSAALGGGRWLALRIWHVRARSRRAEVETPGTPLTGWDHQGTERPPAFMMVPQCARGMVRQVGPQHELTQPRSLVQAPDRTAWGVPTTWCSPAARGEKARQDGSTRGIAADVDPALGGRRSRRPQGRILRRHQEGGRALQSDQGTLRPRRWTRAIGGGMVRGRSSDGNAESRRLTPEDPPWASPVAGSGDASHIPHPFTLTERNFSQSAPITTFSLA
jgi:hypothetical protein